MASMNTRLNIEKLDGNIVQKHRGLKQVGLKQLGSKQVGFKQLGVKQGAQENCKAEVIQESHDHAAVAQRKLKVKQLKGKTNTDCLMGNAAERYSGDNNMVALGVVVVIEEYAHEPLTFRDAVAYEIISKWISVMTEDMDTRSSMTRSGNTPRVSQFWFSNEMSIQILLGGQSMMLLEGGLSGNHDKEKKKSFELRLVAGIATCALRKVVPWFQVPALVEVVVYQRRLTIITKDAGTWHGGWRLIIDYRYEVAGGAGQLTNHKMPRSTTVAAGTRKEDFDINSPLGEQVVYFLMENEDVAGLPRHLEFEDISSLYSPKSAPLNYEPLGNPDSVSRFLETSDLIVEELTADIGLDDSIPTEIDDGYYDLEGDILFLEHLLIEVVSTFDENKDVAGLPRHLVKQLFSQLVKNLSSTKRMSDEPLGDDSKPRSYDVTFSNPLFDFNDDFTLCNDNPLFDEKFEDISSLDSPKSAPLNYEPLGNPDSVSRSLETSDLILEELTAEIGLDDSILTEIDDGYYDLEGDILIFGTCSYRRDIL
ncbi:hypothetical protein Tco_0928562 [Tanacetum coccineum]